jgi:hypothetical protein
VIVTHGPSTSISPRSPPTAWRSRARRPADHPGSSVAPVGGVNGDVILGAPWAAPLTRTSAGAAFAVYGTTRTGAIDPAG